MPVSDDEARLIGIERGIVLLEAREALLKIRAVALAQRIRELARGVAPPGSGGCTPGTTTVSGTVRGCVGGVANQLLAGATVDLIDHLAVVQHTTTTSGGGTYSLAVDSADTYTVRFSKAGYTTVTTTPFAIACGAAATQSRILNLATIPTTFGPITGCGCPLLGATITYTGPASGSGTTDAAGNFAVSLPAGTYTWHSSLANFTTGANRTLVIATAACTAADTQTLVSALPTTTNFCYPNIPCFVAFPASITVTFNGSTTFPVADQGITDTANISGVIVILGVNVAAYRRPASGFHRQLDVFLTSQGCGTVGHASGTYAGITGPVSLDSTAGSSPCPIAETLTWTADPNPGLKAAVTISP